MSSSNSDIPGHAIPKGTIVGSYVALLFFTAVMLILSRIDVASLNVEWIDLKPIRTTLIMGSALIMGLIVSMFLMGLRYESKLLNLTIFLSNFVFLLIFVLFTWVDTSFRGEVDPTFNEKFDWESPVKAAPHGDASHGSAPAAAQEAAPAAGHEAPAATTPAPAADSAAKAAPAAPAAGH